MSAFVDLNLKRIIKEIAVENKTTVSRVNVERNMKAPLSYIVGYETYPVPHFHMLVACARKLDLSRFHRGLRLLYGSDPSAYQIQEFDNQLDGLPYVLKTVDHGGEWDAVGMEYYYPEAATNCRQRYKLRRHQMRLEMR